MSHAWSNEARRNRRVTADEQSVESFEGAATTSHGQCCFLEVWADALGNLDELGLIQSDINFVSFILL